MNRVDMGHGKVYCILCQRSEETSVTGPLSTKESVTAHQNCLLYSSGIFCQSSPEFDDLFGFSVDDVKEEVKRGARLFCSKCKKKGATAGCEIKRCKKSYHYPCAIEEGAQNVEDDRIGSYGLYCLNHSEKAEKAICRRTSYFREPEKSKKSTKAASPNVCCLTCRKTEEKFSFESLNNCTVKLTCEKHKPSPHQQNSHPVAGPSYSSDSSSSLKSSSSKRRLSSNGKQEGTPSKRIRNRVISDDSDSDQNNDAADLEVFAPLESDIDESHSSNPEHQTVPQSIRCSSPRNDDDIPAASTSGIQNGGGDKEEDETLHSDAESESLLLPVMICMESDNSQMTVGSVEQNPGTCSDSIHGADPHTDRPSNPHGGSNGLADTPPCPGRVKPPCNSSAISPAHPENRDVPRPFSDFSPTPLRRTTTPSPASDPSVPEPKLDCANFWKCCNEAGCTQAIFSDFINEMNNISNRIQSDQATQEDYKLALKVLMASGRLTELMVKQQEDLNKKQIELQKAAAAMKQVMSALK